MAAGLGLLAPAARADLPDESDIAAALRRAVDRSNARQESFARACTPPVNSVSPSSGRSLLSPPPPLPTECLAFSLQGRTPVTVIIEEVTLVGCQELDETALTVCEFEVRRRTSDAAGQRSEKRSQRALFTRRGDAWELEG